MAFRYLLPTVALVGSALAQCGSGGDFTINSASDVSQIQNCVTYNGNVIINGSVTGTLTIDGVRQITGDLRANGADTLNTISAPQLQGITGALDLQELQTLSTLQMPFLTSVGSINFIGLPNLNTLQFTTGVTTASKVYISNTNLRDLKGIELDMVDQMDINNNMQLATVNVNNMTNVTTSLSFSANSPNLNILLPNLVGAANLTFRAVASVEIPSLIEVPGDVGFYDATFQNISAANLTRVGKTLALVSCPQLANISFPELILVRGGLVVANNTNLAEIEGFPSLSQIGGAIDFYGSFSAADLPALSDVRGGANIITTATNSSICNSYNTYHSSSPQVIRGTVNCKPGSSASDTNTTGTDGSGSNSSSGGDGKSAASTSSVSSSMVFTGVATLVAALLFL